MAMVNAGDTRAFTVAHVISGSCASGSPELMEKRSPMVSTDITPNRFLSTAANSVISIMAMSEPGIFLLNLGVADIMTMLITPIKTLHMSAVWKFRK